MEKIIEPAERTNGIDSYVCIAKGELLFNRSTESSLMNSRADIGRH